MEHVVDFKMNKDKDGDDTSIEPHKINARDFFVPTQVMILCMCLWSDSLQIAPFFFIDEPILLKRQRDAT